MNNKIVVIGGGGHAKVLINIIKKSKEFEILGYVDNFDCGNILDVNYLGNDEVLLEYFNKGVKNIVIGVGQIGLANNRIKIYEKIKNIGFILPNIISRDSVINEKVNLGFGNQIFDNVVINPYTEIGDNNIINTSAIIEHDCKIGSFCHISPGVTIGGGVSIGDNTMIGIGSTIIQGIKIKSNIFVGAHSLVVEDLIEPGLYYGQPAKKVK